MGVIKTIVAGLSTSLRKPRLLLILYAVNLLFAGLVAVPFLFIVQRELGSSLLGLGVRPIDPAWLGEAALAYGSALPALLAGLVAAGLVYLVLHIFLNGGIVGRVLDREGPAGLAEFAADGGRYFGRYLRLFLLGLVFFFLTLGLFMDLVGALFEPLSKSAVTEWPPLILSNLHLLIALLLLSVVHMVLDYSRIAVAADGDRSVLRALRHALAFLRKRFFRAWAVYLLIVALTLAGTILFYALFGRMGDPSTGRIVAGLAWMQFYIVFRIWIRTLFVAAQAEFYRAHPY